MYAFSCQDSSLGNSVDQHDHVRVHCLQQTISPAVLKTLSNATLVAGIQRYFFARDDSSGSSTCAFHHCSLLSFRGKGFRSLYLNTSSLAFSLEDPTATLTSKNSPNSWSSAALFSFCVEGQHLKYKTITGFVCHDS